MDERQEDELPPSKTRRKQQAKAVEQIAGQLAALPENQFSQLTMDEEVSREAILARETHGRGAQKRQIKHLAAVLRKREEDLPLIVAQLQNLDQVVGQEKREFHQLESLRDRLCEQGSFDVAFNEMLSQFPDIDRKVIARLARSVHQHGDKRASREIFRRLRDEIVRKN